MMSDKEVHDFLKILEDYRKKISKDKEASRKFLIELGIFTEKGNLRKQYKNLCIPQEQE